MAKQIARPHSLGSCGQEVYSVKMVYHRGSPMRQRQISELNSTEANPVIFMHMKIDIFIGHAILFKHVVNLFLNEKSLRIERVDLQLASVIYVIFVFKRS